MRAPIRIVAAIVLVSATASACSGSSEKEEGASQDGSTVCGSFARSDNLRSALQEATGADRFKDDRSQPDEALRTLREADGKLDRDELAGAPYCRIQSAESGKEVLNITIREALTTNQPDSYDEKYFTFYNTGESSYASEHTAAIYFRCTMGKPAKDILVHADLERPAKVRVSDERLSRGNIVLLNAAARQVSAELGCSAPTLSSGIPKATSGRYA
ncbi:hypothetical protein SHKM778_22100 [Streptomyces sp. KM77-8]|uniref:DUF3558 domain-containing protein n=1 Tax=Streptomyces haneummycinicus TaxID=3074435 RepID=A0AAT9HEM4_9ACTN